MNGVTNDNIDNVIAQQRSNYPKNERVLLNFAEDNNLTNKFKGNVLVERTKAEIMAAYEQKYNSIRRDTVIMPDGMKVAYTRFTSPQALLDAKYDHDVVNHPGEFIKPPPTEAELLESRKEMVSYSKWGGLAVGFICSFLMFPNVGPNPEGLGCFVRLLTTGICFVIGKLIGKSRENDGMHCDSYSSKVELARLRHKNSISLWNEYKDRLIENKNIKCQDLSAL